ncbi:MAG: tRNA (adenosine(37)-N6)-threonylcarbamoyltransferase complex ATPase subunit type 1 TsaE [candidate division KSB1 bacterium]|nr:tRNA (adenosine(37)-N6)-threonylcarbamoyltransferase complex ATPase subunit type 1 TsaE [candidate division KSB1 bacterium]MDZ7319365.1 tRNA (adenosine(37)-N6)-threonylcarbamoyltransferase complex ATPase subunit type 1 TsaE [candidate division KSB1 bacterium]MDZ7340217.1 tRNA (adenosine(37)-N6)-threonylcarbamoyltransferase complex ATPase subunit type 1 TsaE [candidate division KSB1 bacterium]
MISYSAEQTSELGANLAQLLLPGDVVGFFGELGSGKTRLIQGICTGLQCREIVSSPTFVIINEYHGRFPIYHFDLYRIESEQEIFDLGYEEYLYGAGICLIEWAERMPSLLPKERLEIHLQSMFQPGQEQWREIAIEPIGSLLQQRDWSAVLKRTSSGKK